MNFVCLTCDRENITNQWGKEKELINSAGAISYPYFLKLRDYYFIPHRKSISDRSKAYL